MSILIKGMSKKDFEEILKYARYGANNCMIGERAEVVELPSHGRLIDADALKSVLKWHHSVFIGAEDEVEKAQSDALICAISEVVNAPTIIEAEGNNDD